MEMRRKDRALSIEETKDILSNAEYGVLSTVSADGMPYGVPISFAYNEDKIYMHCSAAGGHKINNLMDNQSACFTAVGQTELLPDKFGTKYLSAIAFGNIRIVREDDDKKKAMMAILEKYSPEYMEQGIKYMEAALSKVFVLELQIQALTGKGRK